MTINKNCPYCPCHKEMTDCSQCYCIIYPCEIKELGKYLENGKWDCSSCVILHKKENIELIKKIITDLVRYKLLKKE